MPKTREDPIKNKIMKALKRVPASFAYKTHGSAYGKSGTPDIFFTCAAIDGRSCWFEVKREGNVATPIQEHRLGQLDEAGAITGVVYSVDDVRAILTEHGVEVP